MGNNITYQCGDIGRHSWLENRYNVNWSTVRGTILPISVEISVDKAGWRTTTMSTDRLYGEQYYLSVWRYRQTQLVGEPLQCQLVDCTGNNITYQCGDIGRHGWLENHYNVK